MTSLYFVVVRNIHGMGIRAEVESVRVGDRVDTIGECAEQVIAMDTRKNAKTLAEDLNHDYIVNGNQYYAGESYPVNCQDIINRIWDVEQNMNPTYPWETLYKMKEQIAKRNAEIETARAGVSQ